MRVRFTRHATFAFEASGIDVLVDPMLAPAGAADPVPDTPNQRRNPLVDLPFGDGELEEVLRQTDVMLVTHTHRDHWDEQAVEMIPKSIPILCQPEDETKIGDAGFSTVIPVGSEIEWEGLRINRTGGRHGTGEIGRRMAPVSGFVVRAEGEPVLYVAGDTIWCSEVEKALSDYRPDAVVVNAGAARFLEGDPITMTADDVGRVCHAAPGAEVVAVHMEAINHCLLTRAELGEELRREGFSNRVRIPADGEAFDVAT